MALKRIQQERINWLRYTPPEGWQFNPIDENDYFKWMAVLSGGLEDTPYAGGTFKVSVQLPPNYP